MRLPWQKLPLPPPPPPTPQYALPPFYALLLFWTIPLVLCLTKGSIGVCRLVPQNLFSHEDSGNVHKLLGFACLLHFAVRCLFITQDMGFDASWLTPLSVCMHAMLSLSSLIFQLPKVRIKEGSRIWPEFRLHSIVFALRSMSCLLVVWYEDRTQTGPFYLANVAVVFITLIFADISTNSVDEKSRSNTIRGLETSAIYKYSFSFLQVRLALHPHDLEVTTPCFGSVPWDNGLSFWIAKTYAFTLTLRRKNLVSHRATVVIYACQLALGVVVANMEIIACGGVESIFMMFSVALLAASLRMLLGLNKYLVWSIMSVVVQFARRCTTIVPAELRFEEWPKYGWPIAAATMITIFVGGVMLKEKRKAAVKSKAL
ncbi:MAG: hypothetical protein SGPRY_004548 [Prymnesium sp.]